MMVASVSLAPWAGRYSGMRKGIASIGVVLYLQATFRNRSAAKIATIVLRIRS